MAIPRKPKRQNKRPNRATRQPTYSVKESGKTVFTTPYLDLAKSVVREHFANCRSVSIRSNADAKTVAHFIYGHLQDKGAR